MRTASISQLRKDLARLVEDVQASHEPVLVIQNSAPVAYLVAAEDFERAQEELKRLRHDVFWAGVDEAEREPSVPLDVDALLAEHGLTRDDAA